MLFKKQMSTGEEMESFSRGRTVYVFIIGVLSDVLTWRSMGNCSPLLPPAVFGGPVAFDAG